MVQEKLLNISNSFVIVDKYVVMPDHVHAIVFIMNEGTTQGSFPTLSEIVKRFKTFTTKMYIDGVKKQYLSAIRQKDLAKIL